MAVDDGPSNMFDIMVRERRLSSVRWIQRHKHLLQERFRGRQYGHRARATGHQSSHRCVAGLHELVSRQLAATRTTVAI